MTGGGSVFQGSRVSHGFSLQCDGEPNNLQINWNGNRFHLESLTAAVCSDDPSIDPHPPAADFDTYEGSGRGRYNGASGASVRWTFTDAGEPGRNDRAQIVIEDAHGEVVLSVSGNLRNGNHQAHGRAGERPPPSPPRPTTPPETPPGKTPGPSPVTPEPTKEVLRKVRPPAPPPPPVEGLPSAGIQGLDGANNPLLTPWLLAGITLAISGATLSLGMQLVRLQRERSSVGAGLAPAGQALRVRVSPVPDFNALVETLRALSREPGIVDARAVDFGRGAAVFEVQPTSKVRRQSLVKAVSEALGAPFTSDWTAR